jgi:hypothetical protein
MTKDEFIETKRQEIWLTDMEKYGEDPTVYESSPVCYWIYDDSYWIAEFVGPEYYTLLGTYEYLSGRLGEIEDKLYDYYEEEQNA